jgi:hypothetical protein
MGQLTYLALLAGCLVVTAPLELLLRVRVYPGGIPVEEVLFFLVVPLCSVLALEAVRKVTGWDAGYPAEEAEIGR